MSKLFAGFTCLVISASLGCTSTRPSTDSDQAPFLHESMTGNATRDDTRRRDQASPSLSLGYDRMIGSMGP